jgi:ubiquinone/menaquinone biosynthesis C-methylase UbiE
MSARFLQLPVAKPGSFDFLAPHYLWMERLLAGRSLQECRTAYLPQPDARSVLVLGPGRGLFLEAFLKTNSQARILCIDSSPRMLALAKERALGSGTNSDRVSFLQADILDLSARPWPEQKNPFDLVVSHFFLDCFQPAQVDRIISAVARVASPAALWLIADFCIPPRGFWKCRAQLVLRMAYAFFRATTGIPAHQLANPESSLASHGFELSRRRSFNHGLLRSDLWQKRN